MFLDIFTALLACGAAAAWVLTGRGKLPPDLTANTGGAHLSEGDLFGGRVADINTYISKRGGVRSRRA
jgi:hypothetical protein